MKKVVGLFLVTGFLYMLCCDDNHIESNQVNKESKDKKDYIVVLQEEYKEKEQTQENKPQDVNVTLAVNGDKLPIEQVFINSIDKDLIIVGEKSIKGCELLVWDIDGTKTIRKLSTSFCEIETVAFSSDGKYLAAISNSKKLSLWEYHSGKKIVDLQNISGNRIVIKSEKNYFIANADDNKIGIWSLDTGKLIRTIRGKDFVTTNDGKNVIVISDNKVKMIRVSDGEEVRAYNIPKSLGDIKHVAMTSDGNYIVVSSSSMKIALIDSKTGKWKKVIKPYFTGDFDVSRAKRMDISPDNKYICILSEHKKSKGYTVLDLSRGSIIFDRHSWDDIYYNDVFGWLSDANCQDSVYLTFDSVHLTNDGVNFVNYMNGLILLGTLTILKDGEWVFKTPDNKIEHSGNAEQYLSWEKDNIEYPFEEYKNVYTNQKGLIEKVLLNKDTKSEK